MVEFKFHHVMPIFVARQWIRHRTANVNEYSARYSVVKDRFYRPSLESVRQQSKTNRQGGDQPADVATAEEFLPLPGSDRGPLRRLRDGCSRRASPGNSPGSACR